MSNEQQEVSRIIACYYTDKDSNQIGSVANYKYVYINIISENMIGKRVVVDLSDVNHDFKYKGKTLKDDRIENYKIKSDTEVIKVEVIFTPLQTLMTSNVQEVNNPDNSLDFDSLEFDLPLYADLEEHYPKYGIDYPNGGVTSAEFADMVGGKVNYNIDLFARTENQGFANTCALRVSHTLNKNKHFLPRRPYAVSSSRSRKWYIYRVLDLEKYLTSNYGEASITKKRNGDTPIDMNSFLGHKGIIIFDTRGTWTDATGHATLWDGEKRLGGNYQSEYYFQKSNTVKLWIAK